LSGLRNAKLRGFITNTNACLINISFVPTRVKLREILVTLLGVAPERRKIFHICKFLDHYVLERNYEYFRSFQTDLYFLGSTFLLFKLSKQVDLLIINCG
jgi:hypothetical protein